MKIVFIRHSKSLVNPRIPIDTWGISDEGVLLAKQLQNLPEIQTLQVIYSSLQPKAIETAVLATKNRGVFLKTDDRLTETTSFTRKFVEEPELEENSKKYYANLQVKINGGESQEEALNRFMAALNSIVSEEKDKQSVGVVSHGSILATFAAQYIEKTAYQILQNMRQPDVAVFDWEKKIFDVFFAELSF